MCGANQWTGFYIITASVMKGLSFGKWENNGKYEWKIVIFKTLAVSNIVFKLLINIIPNHIIFELIIFQK